MNVAKHVARSSLLIEHLSPTNSRVSYNSVQGGISIGGGGGGGDDGEADGGGDATDGGDGDADGGGDATDGGDGDADGGGECGGRSTVTSL